MKRACVRVSLTQAKNEEKNKCKKKNKINKYKDKLENAKETPTYI